MSTRKRLYAGSRVRAARRRSGLNQAAMAEALGISASYLSQIENDERPVTTAVLTALSRRFAFETEGDDGADAAPAVQLQAVLDDPLFAGADIDPARLARWQEVQPDFAAMLSTLYQGYRQAQERAAMLDDSLAGTGQHTARLPWEEVRDWFHEAGNYIDLLDREAERIAGELADALTMDGLVARLQARHGIAVVGWQGNAADSSLSRFDRATRTLSLDRSMAPESRYFQLAHRLVAEEMRDAIAALAASADLRSEQARRLVAVGLANYAAGALVMPYAAFRNAAMACRHDIEQLSQRFAVSFEQACHRLSTLQRPGARGLPVFFCRVDMAGNITKRHSATRLQFARFGGACPLWVVHEAAAIPDRILVQLAETPDGVRYVSMAKGLVKLSGSYGRKPRRYAVALGCEVEHARHFIYADGLDTTAVGAVTPIGIGCRTCPRDNCDQRAFPPTDRPLLIDPDRRGMVPYRIG
ncbi:helix-turn-helix domain-containing protein [Blastomonas fulva]|uniref:XRE family transcriptional regulator n=1 Tax=Blastomonas fulva TaxID=1550728 RepID=A0ABN5BAE2_9SPHN|nr:XRE family transcriptional regulator [Blastomonas fulva]ASR52499.1 XRE family transcriptional regulator [Blastomonas fulva]